MLIEPSEHWLYSWYFKLTLITHLHLIESLCVRAMYVCVCVWIKFSSIMKFSKHFKTQTFTHTYCLQYLFDFNSNTFSFSFQQILQNTFKFEHTYITHTQTLHLRPVDAGIPLCVWSWFGNTWDHTCIPTSSFCWEMSLCLLHHSLS